jgi:hypothetical protein
MFPFTQSTTSSTEALLIQTGRKSIGYYIPFMLACAALVATPSARATISGEDIADTPPLALVFSDDFSTDPNTNGQWTIHRNAGDRTTEAVWDSAAQAWDLTLPADNRGVAVFANYELTATTWKAEFRYRVGKLGGLQDGGDGFVFMFYKDKAAYGVPAYGAQMGFQLSNLAPVAGYGLEFDNYIQGCDPGSSDYFAIIKDDVCHDLVGREDDWIGGGIWHTVQFAFAEGRIRISIDGVTTLNDQLADPDYSFSGIGFGAGTGSAVGDYEIDSFRLWVAE